jgi:hypothetical protein
MSLDFYLVNSEEEQWEHTCSECYQPHMTKRNEDYFSSNITHNLNTMFEQAGVYDILWHGDGLIAGEQVEKLEKALATMRSDPARFKKYEASNGWGTYLDALRWLQEIIHACKEYPKAIIRCSR